MSRAQRHMMLAQAVRRTLGGYSNFHFIESGTGATATTEGGAATATPAAPPSQTLRAEFQTVHTAAMAFVETCEREQREPTADEKTAQDARFARLEKISKILAERTRFAALSIGNDPGATGSVDYPTGMPGQQNFAAGSNNGGASTLDYSSPAFQARFSQSLSQWAGSGTMSDRQFATITTASQSSIFLPREVGVPIVPTVPNVFREALGLYNVKPMETEGTSDFNQPVLTSAVGEEIAQTASSETEDPPVLTGSFALNVKTYESGSAWFSQQMLLAVGYDLVPFVQDSMVYAKDLGVESAAVAAIIADSGITQSVVCAATTAITYAELASLNRALPKRYDKLKVIILSKAAYTAAEKLVGSDGHPVLLPDPQNQTLLRFNGTPVLYSDYFEALTANKTIGVVISLIGFKLRDVKKQILERYINQPGKPAQVGLNLIGFHGWGYDPAAMAKFKTAVS